ncbi:hypothetical protein LEP1GSC193_0913 [Leptospira alstonii serovar Pingchang str. 80-412]|uniref:Uncharacterized protein n=2 Tax=Leptospira alstonii TaxID=28452 RepID=M6CUV0_9LEPT|nr:hypothetical protein LEP1GSC194_3692 [Leptospira alstonii serovar Sichuan str. 79601]EQA80132.1 hypothetical protein LEP1GSC193_0913 [Leptospira alstonii serovar Pingchang str. 80-412]
MNGYLIPKYGLLFVLTNEIGFSFFEAAQERSNAKKRSITKYYNFRILFFFKFLIPT